MRRIMIGATLVGGGVLLARALAPRLRLHERLMARCEGMFEQMPEDCPPKRMMRGIEEIRTNTTRTVELLEQRKQTAGESESLGVSSTEAGGDTP